MNNRIKLTLGVLGLAGVISGIGALSRFPSRLNISDKRPAHGYFNTYNGDTYFVLDNTGDRVPDEIFIMRGISYSDPNKAWQALHKKRWNGNQFRHYVADDIEQEGQYIRSGREIKISREKLTETIPVFRENKKSFSIGI